MTHIEAINKFFEKYKVNKKKIYLSNTVYGIDIRKVGPNMFRIELFLEETQEWIAAGRANLRDSFLFLKAWNFVIER
jgi:hypothetical protein